MNQDELVTRSLDATGAAFSAATRFLIGYSGGRDSTVLLHAAAAQWPGRVTALHVNHHLIADSDRWEDHCRGVCAGLSLPLEVVHVAVDGSADVEHRARSARYRVWQRRVGADEVLLLAHHLDDQVETVLWRLMRGSGAALLRGMPARRRLGNGELARPFLAVERGSLSAYAMRHGLSAVEDPANVDTRFDRSFLREEIAPRLKARFPNAAGGIARSADALAQDAELASLWLDERLRSLGATQDALPVVGLMNERFAAALLRQWLGWSGVWGVAAAVLNEVLAQAGVPVDRSPSIEVTRRVFVRRYRANLVLWRHRGALVAQRWQLERPLDLAHGRLVAAMDENGELAPHVCCVEVRARAPGEAIKLAGRVSTQRLKALFQSAGVPPWQRATYPLLVHDGVLVMVPGIGVAEGYAADGPGWRVRWVPDGHA